MLKAYESNAAYLLDFDIFLECCAVNCASCSDCGESAGQDPSADGLSSGRHSSESIPEYVTRRVFAAMMTLEQSRNG